MARLVMSALLMATALALPTKMDHGAGHNGIISPNTTEAKQAFVKSMVKALNSQSCVQCTAGPDHSRKCTCTSGEAKERDRGDRSSVGNGCGAASGPLKYLNGNWVANAEQEKCCLAHDQCYDTAFSDQEQCDKTMSDCFSQVGWTITGHSGVWGDIAHQGLRAGGRWAFDGAQKNAIECVGATGCYSPTVVPGWTVFGSGDMQPSTNWYGHRTPEACVAACNEDGYDIAIVPTDQNCKCAKADQAEPTTPNSDWTVYHKAGHYGNFYIKGHRGEKLEDRDGQVGFHIDQGAWQLWSLEDAGWGKTFLKSHSGLYLEDRDGRLGLHGDRGDWQKWKIEDAGGGKVYIISHRGKYLEDRNDIAGLHHETGAWQKFELQMA